MHPFPVMQVSQQTSLPSAEVLVSAEWHRSVFLEIIRLELRKHQLFIV